MLKKFIKLLILLIIIGALVYKFFFYIDLENGCFIKFKVSLTEFSTGNIKESIKVLKYAEPEEYLKLCTHINKINPNLSCAGFGGGCFYNSKPGQIDMSTAHESFVGQTAAIVVHEVCHAIQHDEGRELSEDECYNHDNEIIKNLVEH
jgi:hypothetical protein